MREDWWVPFLEMLWALGLLLGGTVLAAVAVLCVMVLVVLVRHVWRELRGSRL